MNVFDEKMLYHVCLIPFCIIDIIPAKCFLKGLNNLLLSTLPQRVPDLDKKLDPVPTTNRLLFVSSSFFLLYLLRPPTQHKVDVDHVEKGEELNDC